MVLNVFVRKSLRSNIGDNGPERGSVLLELSVVLPLCLFFLLGILELGRLLAQYSWVQQTTYNAAYLSSGMTTTTQQGEGEVIAGILFEALNSTKKALKTPAISVQTATDTVLVNIKSDLNLLSSFYPLSLDTTTIAPSVVVGFHPATLTDFENGMAGEFYDCTGALCPGGIACATSC